jgi:hypothetical protein
MFSLNDLTFTEYIHPRGGHIKVLVKELAWKSMGLLKKFQPDYDLTYAKCPYINVSKLFAIIFSTSIQPNETSE